HQALQTLTSMRLPGAIASWRCWLAEERTWHAANESSLTLALERGSEEEAMEALAHISEHRFERHRMSTLVAAAPDPESRALRLRACQVLRLLASPRSHDALTVLAQVDDGELAGAARAALGALPERRDLDSSRASAASH